MDYSDWTRIINSLQPDVVCHSAREFVMFYESEPDEDTYIPCDDADEYPITIKAAKGKGKQSVHVKAVSPLCLYESIMSHKTAALLLPIVVEAFDEGNDMWHQMTFVIDITNKIMFIHDPNGKSRYSGHRVHSLFEHYVSKINSVAAFYGHTPYTYIMHSFPNMNHELRVVGGHNCVIASIVFIIVYSSGDCRRLQDVHTTLQTITKGELQKIYIALYNKIGSLLALQQQ